MELKRGMHQYPNFPTTVRMELVSGCNRHCYFCGISNKGAPIVMKEELFQKILQELAQHIAAIRTIEVSLHGESTLDTALLRRTRELRALLPDAKFMIATNGDVPMRKGLQGFRDMFEAGFDFITFDIYDKKALYDYERAKEADPKFFEEYCVTDFYKDKVCQYSAGKPAVKTLIIIDESNGFNSGHTPIRTMNTQGGNVPYEVWKEMNTQQYPLLKTCAELLKYIAIRVDGSVPVCCADGSLTYFVGSVAEQSIEEIWKGERANEIRFLLKNGRRDCIPACYACNRESFRDGLWPLHNEQEHNAVALSEHIVARSVFKGAYKENMLKLFSDRGIANRFIRKALGME